MIDLEYFLREGRFIFCGDTWRDRAILFRLAVRAHAEAKGIRVPPPREHVVRVAGICIRLRSNDYVVLFDVLGLGAYNIGWVPGTTTPKILDVGANIGITTLWLSSRYPQASFLCVEPAAHSFALLSENLAANGVPAKTVRAAVTAKRKRVTVVEGRAPGMTYVAPVGNDRPESSAVVNGMTICDLLDTFSMPHVDLLKMDVEGGEVELLETAAEWSDRVGAIVLEVHEPYSHAAAQNALAKAGFERIPLGATSLFETLVYARRI